MMRSSLLYQATCIDIIYIVYKVMMDLPVKSRKLNLVSYVNVFISFSPGHTVIMYVQRVCPRITVKQYLYICFCIIIILDPVS